MCLYKVSGKKAKEIIYYLNYPDKIPEKYILKIDNFNKRIKKNRENEAIGLKKIKRLIKRIIRKV